MHEKLEQEQRNIVVQAWYISAFQNGTEGLPKLEDLFKDKDKPKKTANEEIMEIAKKKGMKLPKNY